MIYKFLKIYTDNKILAYSQNSFSFSKREPFVIRQFLVSWFSWQKTRNQHQEDVKSVKWSDRERRNMSGYIVFHTTRLLCHFSERKKRQDLCLRITTTANSTLLSQRKSFKFPLRCMFCDKRIERRDRIKLSAWTEIFLLCFWHRNKNKDKNFPLTSTFDIINREKQEVHVSSSSQERSRILSDTRQVISGSIKESPVCVLLSFSSSLSSSLSTRVLLSTLWSHLSKWYLRGEEWEAHRVHVPEEVFLMTLCVSLSMNEKYICYWTWMRIQ